MAARIALALIAVGTLALGTWFALQSGRTSDRVYTITGILPVGTGERPFGVVVENGEQFVFRSPPGLSVGDPMTVRYDAADRIVGTIRNGQYIAKANQPSKVLFGLPLAVAAALVVIAIYVGFGGRVRPDAARSSGPEP